MVRKSLSVSRLIDYDIARNGIPLSTLVKHKSFGAVGDRTMTSLIGEDRSVHGECDGGGSLYSISQGHWKDMMKYLSYQCNMVEEKRMSKYELEHMPLSRLPIYAGDGVPVDCEVVLNSGKDFKMLDYQTGLTNNNMYILKNQLSSTFTDLLSNYVTTRNEYSPWPISRLHKDSTAVVLSMYVPSNAAKEHDRNVRVLLPGRTIGANEGRTHIRWSNPFLVEFTSAMISSVGIVDDGTVFGTRKRNVYKSYYKPTTTYYSHFCDVRTMPRLVNFNSSVVDTRIDSVTLAKPVHDHPRAEVTPMPSEPDFTPGADGAAEGVEKSQ